MAGPPLFIESFFDTIVAFNGGGKAKRPKAPKAKNPHSSGDFSCAVRRHEDHNEGSGSPKPSPTPITIVHRPTTVVASPPLIP